jgi:hypothetical protein
MREVVVSVTDEDIRLGKPKDGTCCPVALALRRAFPGVSVLDLDQDEAEILFDNGDSLTLDLPPDAGHFVNQFDRHGPGAVAPFSFDLEVEEDCPCP